MANVPEKPPVSTSLQNWLQQGEQLYATAMTEFRAIEAQIEGLEAKLLEKQDEVNKLAQMIGKPGVEGGRRPSNEIVPAQIIDDPPPRSGATSNSNATIARALTGRFGR